MKLALIFSCAAFPDRVKVVVIENAGHALLPEQPETIARAVLEFLKETAPPGQR